MNLFEIIDDKQCVCENINLESRIIEDDCPFFNNDGNFCFWTEWNIKKIIKKNI